jgi:GT2 family glycosyltransferase
VAYNDVDFCLKVRQAGYHNVYCPHAELYHFESKTRGDDAKDRDKALRFEQEKALLFERWGERIKYDPYYSPNLTREAENFSIRLRY